MTALFFHGVPDTPAVWQPLIEALGLSRDAYNAPRLPGFGTALAAGFTPNKESYLEWMLAEIEGASNKAGGPIDIIAHDWGALLATRAISLRPDLVGRYAICGAALDPDYQWHITARRWQMPVIGELLMAVTTAPRLSKALIAGGLPASIAEDETKAWDRTMRRAILALYRSARHVTTQWAGPDLKLPQGGLVIWGAGDPYGSTDIAERFAADHKLPLHVEQSAGHWAIAQAPVSIAAAIKHHWAD